MLRSVFLKSRRYLGSLLEPLYDPLRIRTDQLNFLAITKFYNINTQLIFNYRGISYLSSRVPLLQELDISNSNFRGK